MSLSQNLFQHWSNNWMLKVTKDAAEINGIRRLATARPLVRNDEAVGSIPTSSTKMRREIQADGSGMRNGLPSALQEKLT